MHCSLFGKLPAKRDFIAVNAPREFLAAWVPWLQVQSRHPPATNWEKMATGVSEGAIWRFWLGEELCGTTVVGAFMRSLDGVGRYFPLTLFACADQGAAIPPPETDAQDECGEGAEELLISTAGPRQVSSK